MIPLLYKIASLKNRFKSLRTLATKLKISHSTLSRINQGKIKNSKQELKILKLFNLYYRKNSIVQWKIKIESESKGVQWISGSYFEYTNQKFAMQQFDELLDNIFSQYEEEPFEIIEAILQKKSLQKGRIRNI